MVECDFIKYVSLSKELYTQKDNNRNKKNPYILTTLLMHVGMHFLEILEIVCCVFPKL
jgi:hypothetical protein